MIVRFKRLHPAAKAPSCAHGYAEDAGADIINRQITPCFTATYQALGSGRGLGIATQLQLRTILSTIVRTVTGWAINNLQVVEH